MAQLREKAGLILAIDLGYGFLKGSFKGSARGTRRVSRYRFGKCFLGINLGYVLNGFRV